MSGKHARSARHDQAPPRHRRERDTSGRILAAGLAMAVGAAAFVSREELKETASDIAAAVPSLLHERADVARSEVPTVLPQAVQRAVGTSIVKLAFYQHPDYSGAGSAGTGVAIDEGIVTAAHVQYDRDTSPAQCQNGLVERRDATFDLVESRGAIWNSRLDVALVTTEPIDPTAAVPFSPAPLMSGEVRPGDVYYFAGYQQAADGETRGPNALLTNQVADADRYQYPVIGAAIAIEERDGVQRFVTGVQSYGGGAAEGVDYVDHGTSGGPVFNADGELAAVVDAHVKDRMSARKIRALTGLNLEGFAKGQQFQIIETTPVNPIQVQTLQARAQDC